jgi:hypothetical protein
VNLVPQPCDGKREPPLVRIRIPPSQTIERP